MNKHTPGPWHWVNPQTDEPRKPGEWRADLRTVERFGEDKTEERDGKTYTSFSLPMWILNADELRDDDGNMEANARLIAAAPDMLVALKAWVEANKNIEDYNMLEDEAAARRLAVAAIARAENSK